MAKQTTTGGGVRGMSMNDLQKELQRRELAARGLLRRRATLAKKLEELDERLAEMGMSAAGPIGLRTKRARNSMSLVDALHKILTGKEMGIPQIIPALATVGYRSESPNLRTMVNVALLKKSHFRRVSRGVYTAKPLGKAAAEA